MSSPKFVLYEELYINRIDPVDIRITDFHLESVATVNFEALLDHAVKITLPDAGRYLKGSDWWKIKFWWMNIYIPLGDTRYVFRISKFVILTYKNTIIISLSFFRLLLIALASYELHSHPANCTAFLLVENICGLLM